MTSALWLLVGLLAGGGFVWWTYREERAWLRKEATQATDRLVAAWRDDKAMIPPRAVELPPIEALPDVLRAEVQQWEDPETRAAVESKIRGLQAQGLSATAILRVFEERRPG